MISEGKQIYNRKCYAQSKRIASLSTCVQDCTMGLYSGLLEGETQIDDMF